MCNCNSQVDHCRCHRSIALLCFAFDFQHTRLFVFTACDRWTEANYSEPTGLWTVAKALPAADVGTLGALHSTNTPPIRRKETFSPHSVRRVTKTQNDLTNSASYEFDMGQNAAATISLLVPPFTSQTHTQDETEYSFTLYFSEYSGGPSLNVANMTYLTSATLLSENGVDFSPSFTYGGFRFVVATVTANDPNASLPTLSASSLQSHFTHSDVEGMSSIVFGGPNAHVLNRIQVSSIYCYQIVFVLVLDFWVTS